LIEKERTLKMNKLIAALAVLVVLALPATASAQYLLKHPKHEHCRAHYIKRVEKVRHRRETFCVHVTPKPQIPVSEPVPAPEAAPPATPAPLPASAPPAPEPAPSLPATITVISATGLALPGDPYFFSVSGSIKVLGGSDLIGTSITYTLTNESTGQSLASFTEPSDPLQPCAIVYIVEGNTQTLKGEAIAFPPQSACPLATVSLPTGQIAELTGSFAGSSTDASSTSEAKVL
jgi:hypothetical protein